MILNPLVYAPLTFDPVLENNSWEDISKAAKSGKASELWKVGDTKSVTLNGTVDGGTFSNLKVNAFIIGFDHNSELEGTNRIHFQLAMSNGKKIAFTHSDYNSTSGKFAMNSTNTNTGGWQNSRMRTVILGNSGTPQSPPSESFLSILPQDLRDVIKPTTKWTDNTAGGTNVLTNVTSTTDYLFLLSEYEVFGSRSYANSNESTKQKRYQYYALSGNSAISYKHNSDSTACRWWLRSPDSSTSYIFCRVYADGDATGGSAYYSHGVSPCFTV